MPKLYAIFLGQDLGGICWTKFIPSFPRPEPHCFVWSPLVSRALRGKDRGLGFLSASSHEVRPSSTAFTVLLFLDGSLGSTCELIAGSWSWPGSRAWWSNQEASASSLCLLDSMYDMLDMQAVRTKWRVEHAIRSIPVITNLSLARSEAHVLAATLQILTAQTGLFSVYDCRRDLQTTVAMGNPCSFHCWILINHLSFSKIQLPEREQVTVQNIRSVLTRSMRN